MKDLEGQRVSNWEETFTDTRILHHIPQHECTLQLKGYKYKAILTCSDACLIFIALLHIVVCLSKHNPESGDRRRFVLGQLKITDNIDNNNRVYSSCCNPQ